MSHEDPAFLLVTEEPNPSLEVQSEDVKIQDSTGVHLWQALGTIASTIVDQSKKAYDTYSKEFVNVASSIKDEAIEAYHVQEEALRPQIETVKNEVASIPDKLATEASFVVDVFNEKLGLRPSQPASTQPKMMFNEDFLLTDHSSHPLWSAYKLKGFMQIQDVQQSAILRNDAELDALHTATVPKILSSDRFWKSWMFFKFIQRNPVNEAAAPQFRPSADWESWENEELGTPMIVETSGTHPLCKSETVSEGWSDWE